MSILANIERYISLTEKEKKAFENICESHVFTKNSFLVKPNEICKYQTYVVKGALRSYFLTSSGDEHTIQFAVEDWFISDFNSYITQNEASLYVQACEKTEVIQLRYDRVEHLCIAHPIFERFFRLVAQKAFAYAQQRTLFNLGLTAKERFIEFNIKYPNIVNRYPQYILASYLGMSAEFLSKIRKQLNS